MQVALALVALALSFAPVIAINDLEPNTLPPPLATPKPRPNSQALHFNQALSSDSAPPLPSKPHNIPSRPLLAAKPATFSKAENKMSRPPSIAPPPPPSLGVHFPPPPPIITSEFLNSPPSIAPPPPLSLGVHLPPPPPPPIITSEFLDSLNFVALPPPPPLTAAPNLVTLPSLPLPLPPIVSSLPPIVPPIVSPMPFVAPPVALKPILKPVPSSSAPHSIDLPDQKNVVKDSLVRPKSMASTYESSKMDDNIPSLPTFAAGQMSVYSNNGPMTRESSVKKRPAPPPPKSEANFNEQNVPLTPPPSPPVSDAHSSSGTGKEDFHRPKSMASSYESSNADEETPLLPALPVRHRSVYLPNNGPMTSESVPELPTMKKRPAPLPPKSESNLRSEPPAPPLPVDSDAASTTITGAIGTTPLPVVSDTASTSLTGATRPPPPIPPSRNVTNYNSNRPPPPPPPTSRPNGSATRPPPPPPPTSRPSSTSTRPPPPPPPASHPASTIKATEVPESQLDKNREKKRSTFYPFFANAETPPASPRLTIVRVDDQERRNSDASDSSTKNEQEAPRRLNRNQKRQEALKELFTTEKTYVDELGNIISNYKEKMDYQLVFNRARAAIKQQENNEKDTISSLQEGDFSSDVFMTIEDIYREHKILLNSLNQTMNTAPGLQNDQADEKAVFDAVIDMVEKLLNSLSNPLWYDYYEKYYGGFRHAIAVINLLTEDIQIKAFFNALRLLSDNRISLDGAILVPVQRVPRYRLLLDALIKYISPEENDELNTYLQNGMKFIEAKINEFNKIAGESEEKWKKVNDKRVEIIGLKGKEIELRVFNRQLIAEGRFTKESGKNSQTRILMLFSDMLAYASETTLKDEKTLKDAIVLRHVVATVESGKLKITRLDVKRKSYYFVFNDKHESTPQDWVEWIEEAKFKALSKNSGN